MRGIISAGGYLPYRRLDRASISEFLGSGGGRGQRTVASYDEDTTTMGVEAGRVALAISAERGRTGAADADLLERWRHTATSRMQEQYWSTYCACSSTSLVSPSHPATRTAGPG